MSQPMTQEERSDLEDFKYEQVLIVAISQTKYDQVQEHYLQYSKFK